MSFLRTFEQLLPDAKAWRLRTEKRLRDFFQGLADGAAQPARDFIDAAFEDLFPPTTRFLAKWEKQFALTGSGSEATRRLLLAATWAARGGQSPRAIQDVLHAAGFTNLFVHEWWSSGPAPYVARDPRLHTTQPLIGTHQCSGFASQPQCSGFASQPQCNRFLANEPGYIVNLNLTPSAPPPVPDDPAYWPYFLYFCGETFGEVVTIDPARRAELETLLLRICPTQHWIVLMASFETASGVSWTLLEDPGTDWTLLEDPGTPWTTL